MEKELNEKKFKMYIKNHGWVSSYKNICYRSVKYGNVNFEYSYERNNASILSYDEVLYTIKNMQRVNKRYVILPEKDFIEVYKKNIIERPEKYEDLSDDILNPPKKKYFVDDGFLMRLIYDGGFFHNEKYIFPYYVLNCDRRAKTSMIINYTYSEGFHNFETMNSFYCCKNMRDIGYIDQIEEIKNHLNTYREKIDLWIQHYNDEESKIYKDINDGNKDNDLF